MEKIQTIMVDNGSKDNSCDFVRQNFPWVCVIGLDKNYGYAGGNNEGLKKAEGDFIALINNDCVVEKNWLKELVNVALNKVSPQKFGAVCSKVLFFYSYFHLEFSLDRGDARISNLKINSKSSNSNKLNESIKYLKGFLPGPRDEQGNVSCWIFGQDSILAIPVPIPVNDKNLGFTVEFEIISESDSSMFEVYIIRPDGKENRRFKKIYDCKISSKVEKVSITFNGKFATYINDYIKDIINSCGLEVNEFFYARDRGFNFFDCTQFGSVEEIFSPSGSSLLINRALLDDVGYFDSDFFTYYEDIDLFWRARLKGWRIYFTPYSVARHYHCGTGREWSYSFTYHVIRNRLLAIFKNGWWILFSKSYFSFFISILISIAQYLGGILKDKTQNRPDVPARIRIFFELFYWFSKKLFLRFKIRMSSIVKDREIKKWLIKF
jgi:GT2 family glycosyltransferase